MLYILFQYQFIHNLNRVDSDCNVFYLRTMAAFPLS